MADYLKQALAGPQQPPAGWVNPAQAQLDARQAAANMPVSPMYSDQEIQQRRDENKQAARWGLLGLMMGDEQQAKAGGTILQQALGDASTRVTDKGVFDPITGTMKVNPQYAAERAQDALDKAQDTFNQYGFSHGERESGQQFQSAEQAKSFAQQRAQQQAAFGHEDAAAAAAFERQKELESMKLDAAQRAAGVKAPSGEQSKAAKFAVRMAGAKAVIDQFEQPNTDPNAGPVHDSGLPTRTTSAFGDLPLVGTEFGRNLVSTDAQKQYRTAQDLWLTANLRSESGAVIGKQEAEEDRRKYFPVPGDPPELIEQKRQARALAEAGMMQEAGNAFAPAIALYQASQKQPGTPAAPLKIERVGSPPAAAPSGPRSMLPNTRAAMGALPPLTIY